MKPFAFTKPHAVSLAYTVPPRNAGGACLKHGDIRKASGFVITLEPLGFVLTKRVGDFLLRVYVCYPLS